MNFDKGTLKLSAVSKIIMGQSPPSSSYNSVGDGLPFLQGKAEFGDTHPTPLKWCNCPAKIAPKDAILISVRAPVGDVNVTNEKCCIGRGLAAIIPKEEVDKWFLYYWLIYAKNSLESQSTGSTFKSINKSVLHDFLIPHVELPEQKAIAHVLKTVQTAKEATEKVIAATKELKKSLMKHLFTYGPVKVAVADSIDTIEIDTGSFPKTWPVVELDNVANIEYGIQAAVAHLNDKTKGTPILTNLNITYDGELSLETLRYYEIPKGNEDEYILKKGDVLFNWRSGSKKHVGKTTLFNLDGDYTHSSFILRIRVKDEVLPEYVAHYLKWLRNQGYFENKRQQSSVNSVFNKSITSKLLIPIPTIDEQNLIVNYLANLDAVIRNWVVKYNAVSCLFNSLLHNLMTGKVRVNELKGVN